MHFSKLLVTLCVAASLAACGSVSSSSAPYVPVAQQTTGPVFISQADLPAGVQYEVIGTIKANARQGYDSVESLYPMLVDEARKVGANAVFNVYGGRTVSAFSWAAPYAGGTAVKVTDPEALQKLDGRFL